MFLLLELYCYSENMFLYFNHWNLSDYFFFELTIKIEVQVNIIYHLSFK